MTRLMMLTGLALTLAACGGERAPSAANRASNASGNGDAPASDPVRIPANFRGIWGEGRAACAQLSHPSRLIISESVIRYPSFVLIGEVMDFPTGSSLAVKGHNQRTGGPAEAHFSIDSTGTVLTDEAGGGAVRVRCS